MTNVRVASCELKSASCELKSVSCELKSASCELPVYLSLSHSEAQNFRGSALPSVAKSKEESLSVRGVCLCVE